LFLILGDKNPRKFVETPYVTWGIIIVCVLIFIWQFTLPTTDENDLIRTWGLVPSDLQAATPNAFLALITTQFLHAGFWHLAGNMWFLNTFGDNIEDSMGHSKFLLFYLLGGIVAAFCHYLSATGSSVPLIGASGAVSAVLGAYFLIHPRARVRVLVFFIPFHLTARVLIGLWFGFQLLSAFASSSSGGGVAFWAHVGGFVAGMLMVKFLIRPEVILLPSKEQDEDLKEWQKYRDLKKKKPEVIRAVQGSSSTPWHQTPEAVQEDDGTVIPIPKPDPRERQRRSMLPANPLK
jgi:membrane associated rhomboid family serine protease